MNQLVGGIEAGGTKFNCAIGTAPGDLRAETRIATTMPAETIRAVIEFFRAQPRVDAIGIGSFGPIDRARGLITTTPKPGWANTDLAGAIQRALVVPVVFDTDVNIAALGEHTWGAARGLDNFIYLTIGTGIGGGGKINGKLLHGLIHPEMGHIRIPHDWNDDPFPGCCPFHGDCLEGLASGPAIEKRWGHHAENLARDHRAWKLQARYLAHALANLICAFSPERIIVGGGLMQQIDLLPMIQTQTRELLNGYIHAPEILERIAEYIVAPELGNRAGVLGAIALAQHIVALKA
ncbi:MAG: ROK family protein [Chloroflexi bacterium]|nr:ROK family protein [Chloroflexota bacterium]